MRKTFMRELAALGLPANPPPDAHLAVVTESDLEPLPDSARRYLRFMRVIGRARDWSFRIGFEGKFRRSRDEAWMKCEAWQYDTRLALARIFYLRLRFFGMLPVLGRDTYVGGRGRMLIRLLDLFTVGDGTGEAYDIGELVTYLNDCILIAPTMLLVPCVRWSEVDANSFDVSITDHEHTVAARVFLSESGAPLNFQTMDRFYADPKDARAVSRCLWTTPVTGWQNVANRMLPTRAEAVWHPPGEDELAYADFIFDPATLVFNVAPGQ
jgi:hypothetical protein